MRFLRICIKNKKIKYNNESQLYAANKFFNKKLK